MFGLRARSIERQTLWVLMSWSRKELGNERPQTIPAPLAADSRCVPPGPCLEELFGNQCKWEQFPQSRKEPSGTQKADAYLRRALEPGQPTVTGLTCQGRHWDPALPFLTRVPQGRRESCPHICGSFFFKPLKILEFKLKKKGSLAANFRSILLIHFIWGILYRVRLPWWLRW